jgi:hypothetical protein
MDEVAAGGGGCRGPLGGAGSTDGRQASARPHDDADEAPAAGMRRRSRAVAGCVVEIGDKFCFLCVACGAGPLVPALVF